MLGVTRNESKTPDLINMNESNAYPGILVIVNIVLNAPPGGGTPPIPIRVCAAQRGRDFGTPDLERGIHFRDVS